MLPRDFTGVFSRYFVVGFFAPAFFALVALKLALSEASVPAAVEPDASASFLVLGASRSSSRSSSSGSRSRSCACSWATTASRS